jgi:hypothetical protein
VITAVNKIVFEGMRSGLRICDDLGDLSFIGLDTESYDAPSSGICRNHRIVACLKATSEKLPHPSKLLKGSS